MPPQKDIYDVDLGIMIETPAGRDLIMISLPDAIAHGKLFIQNNDGTFTPVELAGYWKQGAILTVVRQGCEYDEDGEIVREWRAADR